MCIGQKRQVRTFKEYTAQKEQSAEKVIHFWPLSENQNVTRENVAHAKLLQNIFSSTLKADVSNNCIKSTITV
jgi:hypothetical protein